MYSYCWATLTEVLPCSFLSCNANSRVSLAKSGHGPHYYKIFFVVLCIVCFVSFCVLFLCKCVLYYCHRVATQLQLTNIYNIIYTVSNHIQDVLKRDAKDVPLPVPNYELVKATQTKKKLKYFRPEFTLGFASWHSGHLDNKLHAFRA